MPVIGLLIAGAFGAVVAAGALWIGEHWDDGPRKAGKPRRTPADAPRSPTELYLEGGGGLVQPARRRPARRGRTRLEPENLRRRGRRLTRSPRAHRSRTPPSEVAGCGAFRIGAPDARAACRLRGGLRVPHTQPRNDLARPNDQSGRAARICVSPQRKATPGDAMPRHQGPYWIHSAPTGPPPEAPHTPSNGPCTFRCNSRWRQAVDAYDKAMARWAENGGRGPEPQWPEIEPWPGEPVLCRKCAAAVRGALRELPLAYTALNSAKFLTRTASADEERRGRSDVPPSPSPGADHQNDILHTACQWEDDLRLHLRHQAARAALDPDPIAALGGAVEYLNANWQAMIERPDAAPDFSDEIWRLHRVAVAMVKNKPVRRFLPVPCPSCDMRSLIQEEGFAGKPWYVECSERLGGCSRLFSENEYDWLRSLITSGHVPTAVAA